MSRALCDAAGYIVTRDTAVKRADWRGSLVAKDQHQKYYDALSQEEKMLLILRDELYGGSWEKMSRDLKDRLTGKPYIFKLVHRIEEDLIRIEKLDSYEQKNNVNLADFAQGADL